jgi:hypothetical protein
VKIATSADVKQPSLFEEESRYSHETPVLAKRAAPIAASTDPESSHIAARDYTASGARGRHKAQLLNFLRQQTRPLTSFEIARAAGFDRVATARRLPDAARDGTVQRCGMRTCEVTGRPAITWRTR